MKGPVPNHPHGDRDASIDALLRQTLRDDAPDATGTSCVDADLLAAWADRSVPDAEALSIETHVAGCARCQAVAATLARASAPLAEPRPSFWTRWQVGWLVPVAAAAALAIWIALPDRRPEGPALESVQSRIEPPAEPLTPEAPAPPAQAPPASPVPASQAGRDSEVRTAEPAAPSPEDERRERRLPESSTNSAAKATAGAAGNSTEGFAPVTEPASRADAASADRPADTRQELAGASQERQASVAAAAPAVPQAAAPAAPPRIQQEPAPARAASPVAGSPGTSRLSRVLADASGLVVAAPNASLRWRISARRRLERSLDAGATWTALAFEAPSDLVAGAALGGTVCWFVGRAGLVAVTTDGSTFTRAAMPAAADLVAVRPEDARTAVVVAANGASFRTTDGGATWQSVAR
jgi:hypothetical protein